MTDNIRPVGCHEEICWSHPPRVHPPHSFSGHTLRVNTAPPPHTWRILEIMCRHYNTWLTLLIMESVVCSHNKTRDHFGFFLSGTKKCHFCPLTLSPSLPTNPSPCCHILGTKSWRRDSNHKMKLTSGLNHLMLGAVIVNYFDELTDLISNSSPLYYFNVCLKLRWASVSLHRASNHEDVDRMVVVLCLKS